MGKSSGLIIPFSLVLVGKMSVIEICEAEISKIVLDELFTYIQRSTLCK